MINKYLFVFECIFILSSGLSLPIKVEIYCKNCLNVYINEKPLNLDFNTPQGADKFKFETEVDLKEEEVRFLSVKGRVQSAGTKGRIDDSKMFAEFKIGELQYSTSINGWDIYPYTLGIIYDKAPTPAHIYAVIIDSSLKYESHTYFLKISKSIKINNFKVKIKNNIFFTFPLEKYLRLPEKKKKMKYFVFTKFPRYGIINSEWDSGKINSYGKYYISDSFSYIINRSIVLSNKKVKRSLLDSVTLYVVDEEGLPSNEVLVEFIYCYDVIGGGEICIDGCPENYVLINDICVDEEITKKDMNGISYVEQTADELMKDLEKNFKAYKTLDPKISGENFFFEIISSSSSTENNKKSSSIDFTECEKTLKEKYGIDEVNIAKIDIKSSNPIAQVEYMAFDKNGKKIDLNYCKGEKITVELPLGSNLDMVSKFNEQGIDIFDENSPFFNDKCFPYKSEKGDVPLKDRRSLYYQGGIIEKGCSYSSYNDSKVKLECEIKTRALTSQRSLSAAVFGKELLDSTSINLVTCYNILTVKNLLKTNYGLWTFGGVFIAQTFLFFFFIYFGYKNLAFKIICRPSLANPHGRVKVFAENNASGQSSEMRFAQPVHSQPAKPSEKIILPNYFRDVSFNKKINSKNPFKTCWFLILVKIKLYTIIYTPGLFHVISLSLSKFLSSFLLDFAFNALFFSEKLIAEKFQNGGKLKISARLILPVLSNILGSIFSWIFFRLDKTFSTLELLKDEKYKGEKSTVVHDKLLRVLRGRITMHYIVQFLVISFIGYYLTVFCIVYPGSQLSWLFNCVTGILISGVFLAFVCFVVSLIRSFALCSKLKPLYQGLGYMEEPD